MGKVFNYAAGLLLTAAICLTISPANAQRRGTGGGGMGGGTTIIRGGYGYGWGMPFGWGMGLGWGMGWGYGAGYGRVYNGPGLSTWGYPNPGFRLGAMPVGFYPFYYGTGLYYYSGGAFYRGNDTGGYTVTDPPVGAAIPDLPKNARSIVINGEQYYEFRGVYYNTQVNDKGETIYVVAGKDGVLNTNNTNNAVQMPKVGDLIEKLPEGSRKVTLNGVNYFAAPDGVYYEMLVKDGATSYRVASVPAGE